MTITLNSQSLPQYIGKETGVSKWFTISQQQIDSFADATHDHQFIHVDPLKAKETPFGCTIAHGFLSLSMLSAMAYEASINLENLSLIHI